MKELQLEIALAGGARPRKHALRFFVKLVIALELAVMDDNFRPYMRGYAWMKLLKVWGPCAAMTSPGSRCRP